MVCYVGFVRWVWLRARIWLPKALCDAPTRRRGGWACDVRLEMPIIYPFCFPRFGENSHLNSELARTHGPFHFLTTALATGVSIRDGK